MFIKMQAYKLKGWR